MSTAVVAIEGVLGQRAATFVTMQPNPEGFRAVAALATAYRVVLVTDETDEAKIVHWLRSQGVAFHDDVLAGWAPGVEDTALVRARQVRALRSQRTPVALVVDTEPEVVAEAMAQGIVGLLWGAPRPALGRVDLVPRGIRGWDSIVAEQATQRGLRETT